MTVAGNGNDDFFWRRRAGHQRFTVGPQGVAVDSADNLYIADSGKLPYPEGVWRIIATVAGHGTSGFVIDGVVPPALRSPTPLEWP